jgi:hypothetical protein
MLETTRTQALSEPAAVAAALWLQAWLDGRAGADDLLTVLSRIAPDTPAGLHENGGALPATDLLARVRGAQVTQAWPVLPRPGQTAGWPTGVPDDPCPAVLLVRSARSEDQLPMEARALLRAGRGGWVVDDLRAVGTPYPAGARPSRKTGAGPVGALTAQALSPRTATRRFGELLDDAAVDLGRLGLDRAAAAPPESRWTDTLTRLPGTTDRQLVDLVQRSGLVLDALDQALLDDGAAVTASEARARSARLLKLRGELCDLMTAVAVGTPLV